MDRAARAYGNIFHLKQTNMSLLNGSACSVYGFFSAEIAAENLQSCIYSMKAYW